MPTKKKDTRHPRLSEGAMIGMLPTPSPHWYEMLDWDEMGDTWWRLREEIREEIRKAGKAPKFDVKMKVEYTYYVCQDCDYIGGSSNFSKISQTQYDYDVNSGCPKCHSINVKKRVGITEVKKPSLKIERLIRESQNHKHVIKQ